MTESTRLLAKAALVAVPVILLILGGLYALSSGLASLLGLPPLNPPLAARLAGGAIFIAGLALASWAFRYRRPSAMIVSTYYTFTKMVTRTRLSELKGRNEPLIIDGPQKHVRHPLYLGVTTMFLGWAIFAGSTTFLLTALMVFLWFRLVLIPFEESELRAIFGDRYLRYSAEVPMLIPLGRRKRARATSG